MSPTSYQTAPPRRKIITAAHGVVKLGARAISHGPVTEMRKPLRFCHGRLWLVDEKNRLAAIVLSEQNSRIPTQPAPQHRVGTRAVGHFRDGPTSAGPAPCNRQPSANGETNSARPAPPYLLERVARKHWPNAGRCYRLSGLRSHASTILVGSMASRSSCSSRIFPSLPTRKLIRRAALYLST
jgi:hypothetical protein